LESAPTISVIIPTHNRKDSLLRTLASLRQQSFPVQRFGVIVVDDGSTDDTPTIVHQLFPFTLRYVRQPNQGATAARNHGATLSQAEILVFIDDDITVSPHTLEALARTCFQKTKVVGMGILNRRGGNNASLYTAIMLSSPGDSQTMTEEVDLHFVECNTELLACKRNDFFELGMLQDPTQGRGWPNWDDVDFGYRAHRSGFRLLQSGKAIGDHWDYSMADRTTACQRWYRASRSAVWLFNKHPELRTLIPMLYDKTPLSWGQDSPGLIARKLGRSLMSSPPMLGSMEKFISLLERHYPSPLVLRRLYHLLQGAYMFQGYRGGLREFEQAGVQA
jgi:glycosyltransferase involved in cell wall biosynthesis